jgi:hypothetical protein
MTGTNIINYKQKLREQAEQAVKQEVVAGGTMLSTRGGVLTYGEETLPGNQACVIILDSVKENTYYGANKFDPDAPSPPICYAFGRGPVGEDEMAPHESMQVDLNYFKPQHDSCTGCQWNEWGSADKGRGKACQNRRRLALIPAGFYEAKRGSRDLVLQMFTAPADFKTAEIAHIKLPVLSVKNYGNYLDQLLSTVQLPAHGVFTRMYLENDAQAQFKVCFEFLEEVPDDLLEVIMARHEEATNAAFRGYMPPEEKKLGGNSRGGFRR